MASATSQLPSSDANPVPSLTDTSTPRLTTVLALPRSHLPSLKQLLL